MNTSFKLWNRNRSDQTTTGPVVTDVSAISSSLTLDLRELKTPADDFYERMPESKPVTRNAKDPMITTAIEEQGTYDDVEFYESAAQLSAFVPAKGLVAQERVQNALTSLKNVLSASVSIRISVIVLVVTAGVLIMANYFI